MTAHSLPLDAESINAIRDGLKTQAREVVKPPRMHPDHGEADMTAAWVDGPADAQYLHVPFVLGGRVDSVQRAFCPHGGPGSLVWVREAWRDIGGRHYRYKADDGDGPSVTWRSPMHMPRAASRLTLEVLAVRVERLQDISESDARAEGSYLVRCPCLPQPANPNPIELAFRQHSCLKHGSVFFKRWDSLNARRGHAWAANPWVWVRTFRPIWKNIDKVKEDADGQ